VLIGCERPRSRAVERERRLAPGLELERHADRVDELRELAGELGDGREHAVRLQRSIPPRPQEGYARHVTSYRPSTAAVAY